MGPRRLEIRANLETSYSDVLTQEALTALEALAPLDVDRRAVMTARIERRAARARSRERITFLDPNRRRFRAPRIKVQDARDGRFVGSEIPARPQAPVDSGHGPGGQAQRPGRSRASATSPTRCCPAPMAGCSTARTRSARCRRCRSTTSATCKLAIHRDPVFMKAAEQVAGEMNPGRKDFFGRPIIDDWTEAARLHDQDLSAARAAPRRSPRPARRRRGLLGVDRRRDALRRQQPRSSCGEAGSSLVLYLPKIQTAEEAALWNDILVGARGAPRPRRRHHQGLRARRTARGVLPADGDPRGARPALRRLQHRALGLHQQRRRRDGVGLRRSSTRTSTRSR